MQRWGNGGWARWGDRREGCIAGRYVEQQLVSCNGTVYVVSAVLVFKASDSGLGMRPVIPAPSSAIYWEHSTGQADAH